MPSAREKQIDQWDCEGAGRSRGYGVGETAWNGKCERGRAGDAEREIRGSAAGRGGRAIVGEEVRRAQGQRCFRLTAIQSTSMAHNQAPFT